MHSLVVFASGAGSNAAAIIEYFRGNGKARVSLIVSNKAEAGVLEIAKREHIPFVIINKNTIDSPLLVEQIMEYRPSLLVLAGFLWKIPEVLTNAFTGKIINIHPALLPSYGGKGMYGGHVHQAVVNAREKESGITIHFVNEAYDEGDIIVQARCAVEPGDSAELLAKKIHRLEHFYFPRTIEYLLDNM